MKRWEMVAKALRCGEEHATLACKAWDEDPSQEMDPTPARDLGLEIAAALFVTHFGTNYGAQLAEWGALTGRAKEGSDG